MILKITLFIIFILNSILVLIIQQDYFLYSLLLWIIEFFISYFLLTKIYDNPILKLKIVIQKFLVWNLKNEDIKDANKTKKHLNKNIDFIEKFFLLRVISTLKNIKDEFVHWKEIKWEVELAKEIQWKSLNKELIQIPSLKIVASTKPAWKIWWDSYDIIKQDNNYYIYVWDATWHWVWAWFIMMMVNALISWFSKLAKTWSEILINTNEILKPRVKANLLMSLLLLRWDEINKRIYMTWAGHEYLIIYKNKAQKCYKVKSWWVALGMTKNISKLIKEIEIPFEENDIIVLYSDWITEAINKPSKDWTEIMFGEDRLIKAIEKTPFIYGENIKTATWVFNNITAVLSKFMWYKYVQLDDITLVVIQYKNKDYNENIDYKKWVEDEFITERNW